MTCGLRRHPEGRFVGQGPKDLAVRFLSSEPDLLSERRISPSHARGARARALTPRALFAYHHRHMAAQCPKCRQPMSVYDHQGVALDLCARCHGLWFDAGELGKLEDTPLETTALETSAAPGEGGVICPRCQAPLTASRVIGGGDLVIDECGRCRGVFLDAGELRRIQMLRSRRLRANAERDAALLRHIQEEEQGKREWLERERPRTAVEVENAWSSGKNMLVFLLGLPVEEDNAVSRVPYTVYWTMLAIVGVWLWQAFVAPVAVWRSLAMVPDQILAGEQLYTLATSMFLHGGWVHVLGNLYFLWLFGDNVEDRMGSLWFLLWYLWWGLTAGMVSALFSTGEARSVPHLGASGAIAGAMGAYLVLFPRARIVTRLFGFFVWGAVIKLPAWSYLAFWIGWQFLAVALNLSAVDWWAHIAGFVAGVAVGFLYRRSAQAPERVAA
jgi:membrane associated rhomboid family serine protease/Zn-finger nucleic acid-binding protein